MASTYLLVPVQGGNANIYHYTTTPPQNPNAINLGSTLQQAQQNLGAAMQRLQSKGITHVNTQILNEQGAPSTGELITAGAAGLLGEAALLPAGGVASVADALKLSAAAKAGSLGNIASSAGKAASTGSTALKLGGLAGLLGLTDANQALAVRALEGLVGVALVFLGLQALTGTGSQGSPVAAVKKVVR